MWSIICLVVFSFFSGYSLNVFLSIVLGCLIFFLKFNFFSVGGVFYVTNHFYVDSLSFYFVFLSFLLFIFIYLLEFNSISFLFVFLSNFLLFFLIIAFMAKSALYFILFFEGSFIFIFMIIMLWGHNPERIEALNYFLIYSLVGSVPLIIFYVEASVNVSSGQHFMFNWYHYFCSWDLEDLECDSFSGCLDSGSYWQPLNVFYSQIIYYFFWMLIFFIKFPIFGLHLWLPKAHVESPVYGSMLLAGILIKLGVVGILRFIYSLNYFTFLWVLVGNIYYYAGFGLILVSFICSRQWDLKSFVAYSSVVHMSLIIFSIFSGCYLSVFGCLLMSFAHGLCSSSLFLNLNGFYLISGSRSVYLNRGFLYLCPCLSMFWFLLTSANCSLPISLNFFSEVFLVFSGVFLNFSSIYVFFFNIFFCGLFCIFLYLYCSHGKSSLGFNYTGDLVLSYIYLLILSYHFFILYFFFTVINTSPIFF
nr:NADH dehydrogenase subunit 4 [Platydemus manokwari]